MFPDLPDKLFVAADETIEWSRSCCDA
jgi:hypothetical protein